MRPENYTGGNKGNSEAFHHSSASYWHTQATLPHDFVGADTAKVSNADIVIIGGGLAGLSTALAITEQAPETEVVVLEKHFIGYGASGRNGGLMSPIPAPVWFASARNNRQHQWSIRHLNELVHDRARWLSELVPISEITRMPLCLQPMGKVTGAITDELANILRLCGISSERAYAKDGKTKTSLLIPGYTVHPFGLVQALASKAAERGVKIHHGRQVDQMIAAPKESGAIKLVQSDGTTISADKVIVCTNAYSGPLLEKSGLGKNTIRAKPLHNYMFVTNQLGEHDLGTLNGRDQFTVELNKAYVFYRRHRQRLLFGGIEKISQKSANDFDVPISVLNDLEALFAQSFPHIDDMKIATAWGGVFHQTLTDLPIIRYHPETKNIIFNFGYGGTGVALTLSLARFAADLAVKAGRLSQDDQRLHRTITETRLPVLGAMRFGARVVGNLLNWR